MRPDALSLPGLAGTIAKTNRCRSAYEESSRRTRLSECRAMQRSRSTASSLAHIEVRHSSVHGHGVFAARDLPPGTLIGVYAGRRYTAHEAGAMAWDDRLTYLFALSDGTLIDGAQGGNATRHLNHACEPNCEAVEDYDEDGRLTVRIETTQSIRANDELFLDYALDIDAGDDPSDYPCHCGLARCRGTLVASIES